MREIGHEISYAASAASGPAQAVIRAIENTTGRLALLRRARTGGLPRAAGHGFWREIMERFRLQVDVRRGSIDNLPDTGPLVVVANHPFGLLDGLVLGYLLSGARRDFRILAHDVFARAPQLADCILPIDFSGTADARRANLHTRAMALSYLGQGGAVGVFPGGTVSTGLTPFSRPHDPVWRSFSARMILRSRATVVPIWFDGHNSRLFQLASHVNYTLRMALLMREFRAQVDRPVRLAIGTPIPSDTLARHAADPKELMDFLRGATYALAQERLDPTHLGYEFEAAYRN